MNTNSLYTIGYIIKKCFFFRSFFINYILSFSFVGLWTIRVKSSGEQHLVQFTLMRIGYDNHHCHNKPQTEKWGWSVDDVMPRRNGLRIWKNLKKRFSWVPTMMMRSWGPTMVLRSWGPTMVLRSWGPTMVLRSWGPTMMMRSWGPPMVLRSWGPTMNWEIEIGPYRQRIEFSAIKLRVESWIWSVEDVVGFFWSLLTEILKHHEMYRTLGVLLAQYDTKDF